MKGVLGSVLHTILDAHLLDYRFDVPPGEQVLDLAHKVCSVQKLFVD